MNWKRFFLPPGIPLRGPSPVLPPGVARGDPGWRGDRTPEQKERAFAFEEQWLRAAGEITGAINNAAPRRRVDPRIWTSASDRCPNCGHSSREIEGGMRQCVLVGCDTRFTIEG